MDGIGKHRQQLTQQQMDGLAHHRQWQPPQQTQQTLQQQRHPVPADQSYQTWSNFAYPSAIQFGDPQALQAQNLGSVPSPHPPWRLGGVEYSHPACYPSGGHPYSSSLIIHQPRSDSDSDRPRWTTQHPRLDDSRLMKFSQHPATPLQAATNSDESMLPPPCIIPSKSQDTGAGADSALTTSLAVKETAAACPRYEGTTIEGYVYAPPPLPRPIHSMEPEEQAKVRRDLGPERGHYVHRLHSLLGFNDPRAQIWAENLEWADREADIQRIQTENKRRAELRMADIRGKATAVDTPPTPRVPNLQRGGISDSQKRRRLSTLRPSGPAASIVDEDDCDSTLLSRQRPQISETGTRSPNEEDPQVAPVVRERPNNPEAESVTEPRASVAHGVSRPSLIRRRQPQSSRGGNAPSANSQTALQASIIAPTVRPQQLRQHLQVVDTLSKDLDHMIAAHPCGSAQNPVFTHRANPNVALTSDLTQLSARYRIRLRPSSSGRCSDCGQSDQSTCWCTIVSGHWTHEDDDTTWGALWRAEKM